MNNKIKKNGVMVLLVLIILINTYFVYAAATRSVPQTTYMCEDKYFTISVSNPGQGGYILEEHLTAGWTFTSLSGQATSPECTIQEDTTKVTCTSTISSNKNLRFHVSNTGSQSGTVVNNIFGADGFIREANTNFNKQAILGFNSLTVYSNGCYPNPDGDGYVVTQVNACITCPAGDCCNVGDEASLGCDVGAAPTTYPGAPEIKGDGIDQDCDGFDTLLPSSIEREIPDITSPDVGDIITINLIILKTGGESTFVVDERFNSSYFECVDEGLQPYGNCSSTNGTVRFIITDINALPPSNGGVKLEYSLRVIAPPLAQSPVKCYPFEGQYLFNTRTVSTISGKVDFGPDCSANCIDEDNDQYGQGAGCLGPDCDDDMSDDPTFINCDCPTTIAQCPAKISGNYNCAQCAICKNPGMNEICFDYGIDNNCNDLADAQDPSCACGNDEKGTGEECDGIDLDNKDCISQGYGPGTLNCDSGCKFDYVNCAGIIPPCPNGVLDEGEECDGTEFRDGINCDDYDHYTGTGLNCRSDCIVDPTGCETTLDTLPLCGNGVVDQGSEDCDVDRLDSNNIDLNLNECVDIEGYIGGVLDCYPSDYSIPSLQCKFDKTGCITEPEAPPCGDGVKQGSEDCDQNTQTGIIDFGSISTNCDEYSLLYTGGTLSCTGDCNFDVSQCTVTTCGDGVCAEGEDCAKCESDCGLCASCGDGYCIAPETSITCEADCSDGGYCDDGTCSADEDCAICELDCNGPCGDDPADCGDGYCIGTETTLTCESDCGAVDGYCGNANCEANEDCASCSTDCGSCIVPDCTDGYCIAPEVCDTSCADCGTCADGCGNNICSADEDCGICESDCNSCVSCGDGYCIAPETSITCETDCGVDGGGYCGDNICSANEDCAKCSDDCGTCLTCGDDYCTSSESPITCPLDCGPPEGSSCNDGTCSADEDCAKCSDDCGTCLTCGDGYCTDTETCETCEDDCGICGPAYCGNNNKDPFTDEQCDGTDIDGKICQDLGKNAGTLNCYLPGHPQECTFDTIDCGELGCNNFILDAGEICDTPQFLGDRNQCSDYEGYFGGAVLCSADCLSVDKSLCNPSPCIHTGASECLNGYYCNTAYDVSSDNKCYLNDGIHCEDIGAYGDCGGKECGTDYLCIDCPTSIGASCTTQIGCCLGFCDVNDLTCKELDYVNCDDSSDCPGGLVCDPGLRECIGTQIGDDCLDDTTCGSGQYCYVSEGVGTCQLTEGNPGDPCDYAGNDCDQGVCIEKQCFDETTVEGDPCTEEYNCGTGLICTGEEGSETCTIAPGRPGDQCGQPSDCHVSFTCVFDQDTQTSSCFDPSAENGRVCDIVEGCSPKYVCLPEIEGDPDGICTVSGSILHSVCDENADCNAGLWCIKQDGQYTGKCFNMESYDGDPCITPDPQLDPPVYYYGELDCGPGSYCNCDSCPTNIHYDPLKPADTCQSVGDPTPCSVDPNCPANSQCINDFCQQSCGFDNDCEGGSNCEGGYCVAETGTQTYCGDGIIQLLNDNGKVEICETGEITTCAALGCSNPATDNNIVSCGAPTTIRECQWDKSSVCLGCPVCDFMADCDEDCQITEQEVNTLLDNARTYEAYLCGACDVIPLDQVVQCAFNLYTDQGNQPNPGGTYDPTWIAEDGCGALPSCYSTYQMMSGCEPIDEVCDGDDNDCDGFVDDYITPLICPLTIGVCEGSQEFCTDGIWPGCDDTSYGLNYESSVELSCTDGLDNDCDGKADYDGFTSGLVIPQSTGDNDCPVEVTAISISDSDVLSDSEIEVYCTINSVVNSVVAEINNDPLACTSDPTYGVNGWQGLETRFICNVGSGSATPKPVTCTIDPIKSTQTGTDKTTMVTVTSTTQLTCLTRTTACDSTEIDVMHLSTMSGPHAQLYTISDTYPVRICCKDTGIFAGQGEPIKLDNTCTDSTLLHISDTSNAHVEKNTQSQYTNNVCLSANKVISPTETRKGLITCGYAPFGCSSYDTCVAVISSTEVGRDTNLEITTCDDPFNPTSTGVCCSLTCISEAEICDGYDNDCDGIVDEGC